MRPENLAKEDSGRCPGKIGAHTGRRKSGVCGRKTMPGCNYPSRGADHSRPEGSKRAYYPLGSACVFAPWTENAAKNTGAEAGKTV